MVRQPLSAFVSLCAAFSLSASDVFSQSPLSYSFVPNTICGFYCYHDETGTQLTDGLIGTNLWYADLGNGPAQEWVGWFAPHPIITFQFASVYNFTSVTLGLSRGEAIGNIFLPQTVIVNGSIFSLPQTAIPDMSRGWFTFSGNWNANSLQVEFISRGTWTFVDEAQFIASDVVPEPASMTLLGTGLLGLAGIIRRRQGTHNVARKPE